MFTRILTPLDGSKTAEKVLPYARFVAEQLKLPIELLAVVDIVEMTTHISADRALHLDTMIEDSVRNSEQYLGRVAGTFPGASTKCRVEKGKAEQVIIETAAADEGTLITMATHGRSGINRWLLGSIAEKVLRGATNPLLVVRATEEAKADNVATLKSIVMPLDGSELAESVLPTVAELAKTLKLEVVLFRAYSIPYSAYASAEGYYAVDYEELLKAMREEAVDYLEKKTEAVKKLGIDKVSCVAKEGFAADEIISLSRKSADNLIAMCTHGRSGVKRWVLGSVTETVVRHSADPVLVIRAS
ncbi:MAG TPA: universal stress protein [Candidatus Binatia bacterium]|jgi:nucleotide-binding universal stress UspA family protein|nr:universal stress protein [Candidatus Binatia bacterium]